MWHSTFVMHISLWEKIARTVLVYSLIVVLFRLAGKRGLANLNTLDLTVLLLLSNVVQNAIIGNDYSLVGGAVGAVTLVTVNAALNHALARSEKLVHVVEGNATTVIVDGRTVDGALRRLGIRPSELDHVVRIQNGNDLSEIESGRLEPGGQLVLTLKPDEQGSTKADVAELRAELMSIRNTLTELARPTG